MERSTKSGKVKASAEVPTKFVERLPDLVERRFYSTIKGSLLLPEDQSEKIKPEDLARTCSLNAESLKERRAIRSGPLDFRLSRRLPNR